MRRRPALQKHSACFPQGQIVLVRQAGESECVLRGARIVAPHQFEHRRVKLYVCVRADMRDARDPLLGAVNEGNRAIDIAERPGRKGQIDYRGDAGVKSKAKGQIVVTAGLEQGERPFQVIPRLAILAGEPACYPSGAMGDAGLRRMGSRLDVDEEGR